MNLIRKLFASNISIEGIRQSELEDILCNRHDTISIASERHGNIILSNNKIIKCFVRYYNDKNGIPVPTSKTANPCYYYKKSQQLIGPNFGCAQCHLQCISKFKEGDLSPKY